MYFPDRAYVRPLRHLYGYATVAAVEALLTYLLTYYSSTVCLVLISGPVAHY